jgi:NADH pyrophosphatase NudC (nudix superfamily)
MRKYFLFGNQDIRGECTHALQALWKPVICLNIKLIWSGYQTKVTFFYFRGFSIFSGEALEDTVRREIAEEVGIVVGKVEYFDSQTWPLPQNSLMLACTTMAMPGSVKVF